ncbi:isochorismatase family protein [Actinomycetaceae bacterium TAE3-ERU4]|nr:isochorismatase family protein [Actinomycetaceae bacterium TAE3-ERU4]
MSHALIIVDIQNDFVEGGSLAVEGGTALAHRLANYLCENPNKYDLIATTQDWHIDPGTHFSDDPDFIDSWPPHCRANTPGSDIVDALAQTLKTIGVDIAVKKGHYEAAYSGFEGITQKGEKLAPTLRTVGVTKVTIVGIATDYCVRQTALDAAKEGFETRVWTQMCAGINPAKIEETCSVDFPAAGITVF